MSSWYAKPSFSTWFRLKKNVFIRFPPTLPSYYPIHDIWIFVALPGETCEPGICWCFFLLFVTCFARIYWTYRSTKTHSKSRLRTTSSPSISYGRSLGLRCRSVFSYLFKIKNHWRTFNRSRTILIFYIFINF